MYALTISTTTDILTGSHRDAADAYRALLTYAVAADLYLQASNPAAETAANFTLLRLTEQPHAHAPQRVGTATISPQPPKTANTQQSSVQHAWHWTTQHTITGRHRADTDPRMGYPMALPTTVRAEATRLLTADTINPKAPLLSSADATDQPRPRLTLFATPQDHARNILSDNAAHRSAAARPATDAGLSTALGAAPSWKDTLTQRGAHTA
jgi:hypothetical protein